MSGNEIAGILVAIGIMAVLVAFAFRFLFRGGKAKFKAGAFEGTFDATTVQKIDSIHNQISEINRAVNHREPGEPTLIEMLTAHIEQTAQGFADIRSSIVASTETLADKLEAHIESAMKWQAQIESALPDEQFPPKG